MSIFVTEKFHFGGHSRPRRFSTNGRCLRIAFWYSPGKCGIGRTGRWAAVNRAEWNRTLVRRCFSSVVFRTVTPRKGVLHPTTRIQGLCCEKILPITLDTTEFHRPETGGNRDSSLPGQFCEGWGLLPDRTIPASHWIIANERVCDKYVTDGILTFTQ